MDRNSAPVWLSAERHYESLRDAVWLRMVAEDPRMPWTSFEDAYQEAWTWVAAQDRVVIDSGSPVAYLAQVVRRRYVDELRARRRGVGRKGEAPVLEPLDDHVERMAATGTDDVDEAREARRAVSAIYLLARERLTARELQAFALSYVLEMPPRDAARAMGVSAKRFRNLRWDGWRKVGDEVLSLLEGRLQWCASDEAAELRSRAIAGDADAAGPLRVHLACCAACTHSVAAARRAAAAVLPLPMILSLDGSSERWLDGISSRLVRPFTRVAEWTAVAPPSGRAAAVGLALAASLGGGGVALDLGDASPGRAVARPAPAVPAPEPVAEPQAVSRRAVGAPDRRARKERSRRPRARRPLPLQRAPAIAAAAVPPPVVPPAPAARSPEPPTGSEFGFE